VTARYCRCCYRFRPVSGVCDLCGDPFCDLCAIEGGSTEECPKCVHAAKAWEAREDQLAAMPPERVLVQMREWYRANVLAAGSGVPA